MNGYDYSKEYGPHDYDDHGTSDCKHHCGCWAGPTNSGSKVPGVDPFGECPINPKDGKLQCGKNGDHEVVIKRRIRGLESKNYQLERELEAARPDENKETILVENRALRTALRDAIEKLRDIDILCEDIPDFQEVLDK